MAAVVLACVLDPIAQRDGVIIHSLRQRPGKDEVDPILAELDGRRLVVAGTDADLAAVVLRLLRTERIGGDDAVDLGYLPVSADSVTARLWRLPRRTLDVALDAPVRPTPLVRDDNGGVLVGAGTIAGPDAVVYCDDTRVLSGKAKLVTVTPDPEGVRVSVTHKGVLRRTGPAVTGRACQIGGDLPDVHSDGVPHGRPMPRWTWYRHTEDLRLARP
ncbi:MAG TPA: hypothetical protein VHZ97_09060 [Pseudonocardiaceae bacterium]|nr:hypothetical protein [Pseudonocardiaceae bacterium]